MPKINIPNIQKVYFGEEIESNIPQPIIANWRPLPKEYSTPKEVLMKHIKEYCHTECDLIAYDVIWLREVHNILHQLGIANEIFYCNGTMIKTLHLGQIYRFNGIGYFRPFKFIKITETGVEECDYDREDEIITDMYTDPFPYHKYPIRYTFEKNGDIVIAKKE